MTRHVLCRASELPPGQCRTFKVDGRGVALYNVGGEFYATQDFCRHKGGSLGKGKLEGAVVTCPLHGWRFDVRSGECLTMSHCRELARYPTVLEAGEVVVEV